MVRLYVLIGGVVGIGMTGAALGLTAERPVLPTCDASVVADIVKTNVSQSSPQLIVSGISGQTGAMKDGRWHCEANLSTDRGPIPIKYSVGLVGPGRLQVSMAAFLPR